jgi:hypothetical protein
MQQSSALASIAAVRAMMEICSALLVPFDRASNVSRQPIKLSKSVQASSDQDR